MPQEVVIDNTDDHCLYSRIMTKHFGASKTSGGSHAHTVVPNPDGTTPYKTRLQSPSQQFAMHQ